jgi:hypothetical protein
MTHVVNAGEIRVDDVCPLVRRHRRNVGEDADARVVDQDVEAAETRDGRVDGALRIVVTAHICLQRFDAARTGGFDRMACRRQMRSASASHGDLRAFGCKRVRNRKADPARSAGYDRDLPAYRFHPRILCSSSRALRRARRPQRTSGVVKRA